LFQFAGALALVFGAVLSILTTLDVAVVALPALSLTDADAASAAPSLVIVLFAGQAPLMPESASEHVQAIVTSPLYQPAALGAAVGAPDRLGGTLSTLIPLTVVVALLLALSTAVPVTDWFAALVESVVEPVQLLMPEIVSEHVKATVTSELFQPNAFAAGLRLPVIVGVILSSFTVTEPVPALPRRSVAEDVFVTPVVFDDCESPAGVGPLATPEPPPSFADHVIATLLLFHPAAFGAGESAAVTAGPVLSRT
jgi:hypothetical protein